MGKAKVGEVGSNVDFVNRVHRGMVPGCGRRVVLRGDMALEECGLWRLRGGDGKIEDLGRE